jgi:hypothetical protein
MDYAITGSDTAMQEVDVTSSNVIVPAQFRVAIVFQHSGAPSIADDTGAGIMADKNFILQNGTTWMRSASLGLTGNWVLRAVITDTGGGPGVDAGPGGGGGSCHGNGDCPTGEYCDLTHNACTFDCRSAADCSAGTCNSLGQCIGGTKKGCAIGSGADAATALALVGLALVLASRGRRRRRA